MSSPRALTSAADFVEHMLVVGEPACWLLHWLAGDKVLLPKRALISDGVLASASSIQAARMSSNNHAQDPAGFSIRPGSSGCVCVGTWLSS